MAQEQGTMATAENPLTEELAKFVKEKLDEWKVPGISVGVIDKDQVFTAGYGTATLPDTPATPETLWYAGSTTKAFTGAVIAQLIYSKKYPALEKGWQTTISSILRDDFVLQDEWATNHLTLEDAVSHRTGMPRHDQSASRLLDDGDGGKRHATVKDVTRNLRNLRLSEEPRVKFQYCNLMYGVLSHVIETVTGKSLGEVMREFIFEPLGMTSTYFSLDDAKASPKHLSAGYYWDEKTGKYVLVEDVSVIEHGGAGAIISNTEDYAKWVKCMLFEKVPFSKAVHKDIRTPRIVQSMPQDGKDVTTYALGWDRVLYHGHLMYSHGGGMMAAGSTVIWLPDDKLGLVAFGNTSITSNAVIDTVLYKLLDEKLGIAPEKRTDAAKGWHSLIDHFIQSYDKAVDNLFPNRPNPPIPSPVSIKDLAGKYYDPGYKTIELRVEAHPDKQGEEILVAERDDATWLIHMRLHHVSGTWWIMYAMEMGSPNLFRECEQVEFKIGHDGRATALEVDFYSLIGNQHEGKVVFNRVK
ncbi:Beta-lactamase domain-containing protein [Fusarium keratoplasticum]|nr:Beta-lactamase domain-containing protein [Fusarium keratoplasticum]